MLYDANPVPGYGTLTVSGPRLAIGAGSTDDPRWLDEAIEAREVIERSIARLAALRRTDADVAALRAALTGMRASRGDEASFGRYDLDLHVALWDAARNDPLAGSLAALHELVRTMIALFTRAAMTERRVDELVEHHAQLVDAVERQDADEAAAIIREMMQRLRAAAAGIPIRTTLGLTPSSEGETQT